MLGSILVIIGFFFLARNLGLIGDIDWSIVWPAILIIFGTLILTKHNRCGSGVWAAHCWHPQDCACKECAACRKMSGKVDKPDKPEKAERPEKPERPAKKEKPAPVAVAASQETHD